MSDLYKIKLGAAVVLNEKPRATLSTKEFVRFLVRNEPRFNTSGAGIKAGIRIDEKFASATAFVLLDKEDWALLAGAANQPERGYPVMQFRPDGWKDGDPMHTLPIEGKKMLLLIERITEAERDTPKRKARR